MCFQLAKTKVIPLLPYDYVQYNTVQHILYHFKYTVITVALQVNYTFQVSDKTIHNTHTKYFRALRNVGKFGFLRKFLKEILRVFFIYIYKYFI